MADTKTQKQWVLEFLLPTLQDCLLKSETIEAHCDTLFDVPPRSDVSPQCQFLSTLTLSDMILSDIEAPDFFKIKNAAGDSIDVSNRMSSNGELRGFILRGRLETLKASNPTMTVHDAIIAVLNSADLDTRQTMVYCKRGLANDNPDAGDFISTAHYDLLTKLLAEHMQATKQALQASGLEASLIKPADLLQDIDEGWYYDVAEAFSPAMRMIDDHVQILDQSTDELAYDIMQKLRQKFYKIISKIALGQLTGEHKIIEKCSCCIDEARSDLKACAADDGFLNRWFKAIENVIRNVFQHGTFFNSRSKPEVMLGFFDKKVLQIQHPTEGPNPDTDESVDSSQSPSP